MTRLLSTILWALLVSALWAQQPAPPVQEPPEEDVAPVSPHTEYSFNPIEATKVLKIGNYYFKKGSYTAAARRFEEATKWNPSFAEAYLRLGDARAKLNDADKAREAYARYIELAPDSKEAASVKKKLASKPGRT